MDEVFFQLISRLIDTTICDGFCVLNSDINSEIEKSWVQSLLVADKSEITERKLLVVAVTPVSVNDDLLKMQHDYPANLALFYSDEYIEGFSEIHAGGNVYYIKMQGEIFDFNPLNCRNHDFRVLAIIHFYNEEDIIRRTTEYLLSQEIDVYLLDNWSDDSSFLIARQLAEENLGHVYLERFPNSKKNDFYDWYHQLQRTEEISRQLDYDWFIHYDADEMRIGPWKNVNLKDTIQYIDSLGYNLIENTVIDFKVTDCNSKDIFMSDCWFDFGRRPAHFAQVKTWKKAEFIDLKETGGHIAAVDNPRIFPLKILNRHYPFRSLEQAKKKVFQDRKPRFEKEKKERGWHGHYDSMTEDSDFIFCTDELLFWNENTFDEHYIELFTGCGIIHERGNVILRDIGIPQESVISIYGAGKIGKLLCKQLDSEYKISHWVDQNFKRIPKTFGRVVESPEILVRENNSFDFVVVAVNDGRVRNEIISYLTENGIGRRRILWKENWLKLET